MFGVGSEDEVEVIAVGMGDAFFGGCLKHGGEGMALQGVIARVSDNEVDACAAQSREGFDPVVGLAVHDVIARLGGILPVCKGGRRWGCCPELRIDRWDGTENSHCRVQ